MMTNNGYKANKAEPVLPCTAAERNQHRQERDHGRC